MKIRNLLLAAAVPFFAACASTRTGQAAGDVGAINNARVGVEVVNDNYADCVIYAVDDAGRAVRLGTVTGLSRGNLRLDQSMTYRTIQLVASPIGGNGRAASGPLSISGGQVIEFHIAPVLSQSNAFIR
jgi:hypothetical protein